MKRNFLFLIILLAFGLLLYGCVEKHEKLHHVESVKDVFFHDDGIYYQNNYWGTITDDSMLSKEEFLKNLGLEEGQFEKQQTVYSVSKEPYCYIEELECDAHLCCIFSPLNHEDETEYLASVGYLVDVNSQNYKEIGEGLNKILDSLPIDTMVYRSQEIEKDGYSFNKVYSPGKKYLLLSLALFQNQDGQSFEIRSYYKNKESQTVTLYLEAANKIVK